VSISVGDRLPEWLLPRVSREKMKTMALVLDDPNPIHWDLAAVRGLGMGERPINQGPNNMAYVMNMLADWAGGHEHLRRLRVRFQANVLGDDEVVARGTVVALRVEGGRTLAECDVELVGAAGAVALSGTATVDVSGRA